MAYKGTKSTLGAVLQERVPDMSGDDISKLSKAQIIECLEELDQASALDRADPIVTTGETEKKVPSRGSIAWTPYVLSLLDKTEKVDGQPSVDGLRRVFDDLVGPILSTNVHIVQAPSPENERRATVIFTMTFLDLAHGSLERTISDASDCYYGNSADPFVKHPVATASSMAEGRCLRKALRIKVITADEASVPDPNAVAAEEELIPITENQKAAIVRVAGKLGIDVAKMIAHFMPQHINNQSLDILSYKDAQGLLKQLSEMSRGPLQNGKVVPDEILVSVPEPVNV